jgi:hypothetical protein
LAKNEVPYPVLEHELALPLDKPKPDGKIDSEYVEVRYLSTSCLQSTWEEMQGKVTFEVAKLLGLGGWEATIDLGEPINLGELEAAY